MQSDAVNHPSHYNQGGIECIDAMRSAFGDESVVTFCHLNAFKYLWRAKNKRSFNEDVKKAVWYLQKIEEILNGEGSAAKELEIK